MSQNNQGNNQNYQSKRSHSIWESLTNFSYNPASPESWVRLAAQVAIGGMFLMLFKALDGTTCGRGWNLWVPQTWSTPAGCFTRSLVKNVPDNFLDGTTAPSDDPSNDVLQPPNFQPTPAPTQDPNF